MYRTRLVCGYCGEEIEDWEEVFIKNNRCYHRDCFCYEFEYEYYKRAEELKYDLLHQDE